MPAAIGRRHLVRTGLALAGGMYSGGYGMRSAHAADVALRMLWWGSQDRMRRTTADMQAFHETNPAVTLVGESAAADYWTKVATQMAGRNLADIFQTDHQSIATYAKRGAAIPLERYMPAPLDLAGFGPDMLALGQIDGKLSGVPQGVNTYAIVYDRTVLDGVKIAPPRYETTWAELGDIGEAITKAVGKPNYWGVGDASGRTFALEVWLGERGKSVYKPDGAGLNFTADDLAGWFDYWAGMRRRGAAPTADILATDDGPIANSPFARGSAAIDLQYSNYLIAYSTTTKNSIGLAPFPNGDAGALPGHFPRPALIWSISRDSKHPEAAAGFVNWWVTSPDAAKINGVERGVPVLESMRAVIRPTLTETEQATIDYLDLLKGRMAPFRPWPMGGVEFDTTILKPAATLVAFGNATPAEGARKVLDDAKALFS
jgi:multiple sugar transport system substrate-binding protein